MHRPGSQVAEELAACIRCNQCLVACPALDTAIPIERLNRQTLDGPISAAVIRFAQNCYQCGACVPVCPVGLHRDSMMMWLKMRLLRAGSTPGESDMEEDDYADPNDDAYAQEPPDAFDPHAWAARGWYND